MGYQCSADLSDGYAGTEVSAEALSHPSNGALGAPPGDEDGAVPPVELLTMLPLKLAREFVDRVIDIEYL